MLQEKQIETGLFEIQKAFKYFQENLESEKFNAEFALLVYNNVIMLGQPFQKIQDGLYDERKDKQYIEYCEKRRDIDAKYVDRDEQMNPKFDENKRPMFTEMIAEYTKALSELDSEYQELGKRLANKDENNYNFLKQTAKVKICTMPLEDIPDGIPPCIVGFLTKQS